MKKKNPNHIKTPLSDKLFMISLPIAMIVVLFLAALGSYLIEAKRTETQTTEVLEALASIQETAEQEHPELNKSYAIWEDELIRVRDNLPQDASLNLYSKVIAEKDWAIMINGLIEKIKSENISDKEFARLIIDTVPDEIGFYIAANYFKAFTDYLTPGLFSDIIFSTTN